ncbi:class C sortase [uncultured Vagococcus sp.]|uniref:class C sortase n=1 Tax=uncultured Vagococcus sp. TaxID=189676 RepID=UPI0028D2864C|nr:class C sortase [uncultured Vagococcus sp.]
MWRKRLSLILFLLGLSLILSLPVHGLWTSLVNSNRLEAYEQHALNYQISPELFDLIDKQLTESNLENPEDPFAQKSEKANQGLILPDEAVGLIRMPSINETIPLYMGASDINLANGSAHISGTDLPLAGMGTHTVIAGHRGYYGQPYFLYINYLAPGDLIYLSYLGKEAVYIVTGNELISPTDGITLSERSPDIEWLTLLTCHPFPTNRQRLLVHSRRLSAEEVAKIQSEKLDTTSRKDLLSGNEDQDNPTDEQPKQEISPKGFTKKIAKIGQYSDWLWVSVLILGGSSLIITFWRLLGTWL